MQTLTQNPPEKNLITLQEVITKLNPVLLERRCAYNALAKKFTCFGQQLETLNQIELLLAEASRSISDLQAVQAILKTAPLFFFIAPRQTIKLFHTYYSKLHLLFVACHEYKERMVKTT